MFKVTAAIDYIGHNYTIVHAHVVLVLKAFDTEVRNACCLCHVLHIYQVVVP